MKDENSKVNKFTLNHSNKNVYSDKLIDHHLFFVEKREHRAGHNNKVEKRLSKQGIFSY